MEASKLLLERRPESSKINVDLFYNKSYSVELSATTTSHAEIQELYHGQPAISKDDVSRGLLMDAAISAGEYLVLSVKSDGKMGYFYNPRNDEESENYNLTRHAGTLFAMARLFHHTKDPLLLEKMRLALNWLLKNHSMDCHFAFPKEKEENAKRR